MKLYRHNFGGLFLIDSTGLVLSYSPINGWQKSAWNGHIGKYRLLPNLSLVGNNFRLK